MTSARNGEIGFFGESQKGGLSMTSEDLTAIQQLLQQQLSPALERIEEQSAQIELLKQQLDDYQAQALDTLDHIDGQLQGRQRPPAPITEAWEPLGFKSAEALRGAIRRGVYTQAQGEILRRGTSILVNIQKCLDNGYTPIHRRRRSA